MSSFCISNSAKVRKVNITQTSQPNLFKMYIIICRPNYKVWQMLKKNDPFLKECNFDLKGQKLRSQV
jgi:hypothetical protein